MGAERNSMSYHDLYDDDYYGDRPVRRKKPRSLYMKKAVAAKQQEPSLVQNTNCLVLSVGDRKFFTEKKNFRYLVEATKRLDGKLMMVKVLEGQLLNLKQIVEAFNDPEYQTPNIEFEVLEVKLSCSVEDRQSRVTSDEVRTIIRRELLKGADVSTKSLEETLKDFNLTKQQIKYHFNIVRKSLGAEGYTLAKVKPEQKMSPEALKALKEILKWNSI